MSPPGSKNIARCNAPGNDVEIEKAAHFPGLVGKPLFHAPPQNRNQFI